MKTCANNHTQVAFDQEEQCPVCAAVDTAKEDDQRVSTSFRDDIKALQAEITFLERRLPKRHRRKYDGDGKRPQIEGLYELLVDCRLFVACITTFARMSSCRLAAGSTSRT